MTRHRTVVSTTDRKSLLALRGVGRESEAENVRFHGRRVTKVGPEVKHGLFRVARRARNPKKLPPEGWGPLNKWVFAFSHLSAATNSDTQTCPSSKAPAMSSFALICGARGALGRCRTFQVAENAMTGSVS